MVSKGFVMHGNYSTIYIFVFFLDGTFYTNSPYCHSKRESAAESKLDVGELDYWWRGPPLQAAPSEGLEAEAEGSI